MSIHAEAIENVAKSIRTSYQRCDLETLIRRCKESGIPTGVEEVCFILQFVVDRGYSEGFIPLYVADFLAMLASRKTPKRILDPYAEWGIISTKLQQHLAPDLLEAYSRSLGECEVFRMLEGSQNISLSHVDPLVALQRSSEKYDAVVCNTPFGSNTRNPVKVSWGEEEFILTGDYGTLLIILACTHLSDDGIGIFIVPNSFFSKSNRTSEARKFLDTTGFRMTAAIEMAPGIFRQPSTLSAHIVVFQRTDDPSLFTGKFSTQPDDSRQLIDNLFRRVDGKTLAMGRMVPETSFVGFSAIDLNDRLTEQARRMGLVPYQMSEVVIEIKSPPSSKDFERFPEKPGAVYLPQMAATPATTSQEALPESLKSYFQLLINPDVADAEFVAGLLNTPFGQLWRDSLRSGTTIPRISKFALENAQFYLPPIKDRKLQQKAVECHQDIVRLRNELNELESMLWKRPSDIGKTQNALRLVNHEDRFEDWIDTMPFPLASVLWRCHTQTGSFKDQYDSKLHFFEALAEFLAVVYLSVFKADPESWIGLRKKLNETLSKHHLSLGMSTFGAWRTVVEVLSAETRRTLNDTPEKCCELFKTRNKEIIESISGKRIATVLQSANEIRNSAVGHRGAISESNARAVNEKLSQLLDNIRETFGVKWEGYELLLPGEFKFKDGLFHCNSKLLMGSRSMFRTKMVEVEQVMEDGFLYLKSPDETSAVRLLPLIKVMASPRTEENACYFYNRQMADGIRFLSYYFESDSEVVAEFGDVAQTIGELTGE